MHMTVELLHTFSPLARAVSLPHVQQLAGQPPVRPR